MYADELTLFSLSWLYKQHTVVIMANKLWSTLHSNIPVSEETLLDVCLVKLVYLGQLRFGVLRPKIHSPEFVMVPIAAGGLTKPTTSHHSMQAQPVTKPTTVASTPLNLHITCKDLKQNIASGTDTVPVQSSNIDPGIALNIAKIESSDEDTPLPVGTSPTNTITNTNICAKETGNVETRSSDNAPEHVETDLASKNLPVEMINCTQNNGHVETNPLPEETSAEPPPPQSTNNDSVAATASTSVTDSITASKNKDEKNWW